MSILLDAGPSLNFLAVGQQNVLIQVAKFAQLKLAAPERVDIEVRGKCRDPRFERTGALRTWKTLVSAGYVEILSDDLVSESMISAVARISGKPAHARVQDKRSLGEILVLAHASVLAQAGANVFVLIDERDGRRRARGEIAWLERRNASGSITLWSSVQVLKEAGRHSGWIKGGHAWQQVYGQMRPFDDGLPPLESILKK